ncbi:MAG: hypothetical protein AAF544_07305 [Bacteroidota bacterium]
MAASLIYDYNALRDDHPESRRRKFWYFLLDMGLILAGAYFIYRYTSAWKGESSLFFWWLLPGALCLIVGGWSILSFLRKSRSEDRHLERYVKINEEKIHWWLDMNETPQQLLLADIQSAEFSVRDIHLFTDKGIKHTLHTYLILAPQKEKELREKLQSRFSS